MCCLGVGGLVREEGVSSLPFSGGRSPSAFPHRAQPLSPAQPLVGYSNEQGPCWGGGACG